MPTLLMDQEDWQNICLQILDLYMHLYCMTDIVAMLLPKGRTAHSRSKLLLNIHEHSIYGLKINSTEANNIENSHQIIWDEESMVNLYALTCVNRLLQDIIGTTIPFGGKVI